MSTAHFAVLVADTVSQQADAKKTAAFKIKHQVRPKDQVRLLCGADHETTRAYQAKIEELTVQRSDKIVAAKDAAQKKIEALAAERDKVCTEYDAKLQLHAQERNTLLETNREAVDTMAKALDVERQEWLDAQQVGRSRV